MLWMDSDTFCTIPSEDDPIAMMRRMDLVLSFDLFPMGRAEGPQWPERAHDMAPELDWRFQGLAGK